MAVGGGGGGVEEGFKSKNLWERRVFPRIDRLSSVVEEGSVLFTSRCVGPYTASAQGTPIWLSIVVYAHTILIKNHPLMSRSVGFIGSVFFRDFSRGRGDGGGGAGRLGTIFNPYGGNGGYYGGGVGGAYPFAADSGAGIANTGGGGGGRSYYGGGNTGTGGSGIIIIRYALDGSNP